jgi:hypothetical protein
MALLPFPRKAEAAAEPEPVPWQRAVREFLYGFSFYEFEIHARESRAEIETVFLLITLGDMVGLPVMPPLYSLRVLAYCVPQIEGWKRRMLRERELSDREEYHLHGI